MNQLSGRDSLWPQLANDPRHRLTLCSSALYGACLSCGRPLLILFAVLTAVLFSGGNARAQGTVATDRDVLVALYNATDGANWADNTNWLSTEALSEWYGVTTDGNGRVTELSLDDNHLSGGILAELGDLANLQTLSLYDNQLSGEIPAELGDLTNLRYLALWGNTLSGEIPAELGDLTNLWYLALWGNTLSGEIPAELGDLGNLLYLQLHNNQLTGTIPADLGDLANLLYLYLWDNDLTGTIPEELGDLTNLQELDLYENGLSGEIPAELGALGNLQYLSLSGNELSGEIPAELGNLGSLQELYLNDNPLSGPLPLTLSALSQLSLLQIQDTGLCAPTDIAFQAWLATINLQGAVCDTPQNPLPTTPTPPPSPEPDPEPEPEPDPGNGGGGGGGGTPRTSAPGSPRNLTAAGGNGEAVLSWDAPSSDGGAEITDYEYRINRSGPWISTGSTETTHTVTGLDNGTTYVFEVRAVNRIGKGRVSNRAEATPEVFTLDFAHFANGAAITSDLVFVNVGTQPVRPAIYFYDTDGNPIAAESVVDLTVDLEITEDGALTVQTEMEPLEELTISTHGRGDLVSGSVKVFSEGPIGGVLLFDLTGIGVAGVGASQPVRDAIFPARRLARGISTAAAIRNLGEEAMEVSCQLMKDSAVLEEAEIPLEANGQEARYIEEVFPRTDTSDFVGSVRCTALGEGMFTGVAVELDASNQIFTTLPVVPVQR